jgi:hypothetical protein
MNDIITKVGEALLMAFGMFWKTGWSLVLGFFISAILQAVISKDRMRQALGRDGAREIALASLAGAASSSCSYASAAISRTLFKKGAALIPSLAFLFASTNLVIELGIILYLLLGWQFMLGEWIGGVVLVVVMAVLVRLTYPHRLVEQARQHPETSAGHEHGDMTAPGETLLDKLPRPETRTLVARNFVMDWMMLWKDLLAGFLIAGALSAFVPNSFWQALFLHNTTEWIRAPANALLGPLVAVITFVCSIGNVPMAAVLWGAGVSFGGVLAFLYADLIVVPLLDVYRRYYGWKMAAYIGGIFYYHHGGGGAHHGWCVQSFRLDTAPEPRHPCRGDALRPRLHLLAQHGRSCSGDSALRHRPPPSDEARPWAESRRTSRCSRALAGSLDDRTQKRRSDQER